MAKSVLIVDDHLLFSRSLKVLVDSFQEYAVSHICNNGKELVSFYESNPIKPDIVLLDIKMPLMDGIETMAWIKENQLQQKVLALSMEDDETTIISMLRLGANGYLLKDITPEELLFALDTVYEDGFYQSSALKKAVENQRDGTLENLSKKEVEFLQFACSELTYREIADKMFRSHKTIDGYRENLFRKLEVKNRIGLAIFAIKHKLVSI